MLARWDFLLAICELLELIANTCMPALAYGSTGGPIKNNRRRIAEARPSLRR